MRLQGWSSNLYVSLPTVLRVLMYRPLIVSQEQNEGADDENASEDVTKAKEAVASAKKAVQEIS